MTKLKPGDRVDCRVKASTIVSPYKSYDEIETFLVVAVDDDGCYLYVPHYYYLKGTFVADKYDCKTLDIDKKFDGENIVYILESLITGIHERPQGLVCVKCKEFYLYAEPNRGDGTLICFSCRRNPYR